MANKDEQKRYYIKLTGKELGLIRSTLEEMLLQLREDRRALLDNGRLTSYRLMVEETVEYDMLLTKIRRFIES